MPRYKSPKGTVFYSEEELTPEELDELFKDEDVPEEEPRPVERVVAESPKEKSTIGKAWEFANTPLTDAPSDVANAVSEGLRNMRYKTPERAQSNQLNAMISGFVEGGIEGLGNLATEATSPLSILSSGTVWGGLKKLRGAVPKIAELVKDTTAAKKIDPFKGMVEHTDVTEPMTKIRGGYQPGSKQTAKGADFEMTSSGGRTTERISPYTGDVEARVTPRTGPTTYKPGGLKANGDGTFSPTDNSGIKYSVKGERITRAPVTERFPEGRVRDRYYELVEKGRRGTLTGEELVEARELDKKLRNADINPIDPNTGEYIKKTQAKAQGLTPVVEEEDKAGRLRQIWDLAKGSLTVDIPFITSAAMRQAKPLAGTANWFKAWVPQAKAFTSEVAAKVHMDEILSRELFKQTEIYNPTTGKTKLLPSYAESAGLRIGEMGKYSKREESLRTGLAEKIPGFGRWVKASNRSYTAFLNDLRANTFQSMIEDARKVAESAGDMKMNPDNNIALRKSIADFVNNATGAGSLGSLEKAADELSTVLFSPKNIASQIHMLNPANYMNANPTVRKAYLQSAFRTATLYAATAGLAKFGGAEVSLNPTSADFGKIKIGNTRYDFGGGYQQYLVQMARQALGGSTSSTDKNPKFQEFGGGYGKDTRFDSAVRFGVNKLHPSLGAIITGILDAAQNNPVDISDKVLQTYIPLVAQDIMELAVDNPELLPSVSLMSMGVGGQTYEEGSYGKPQVTPFIEQFTGMEVPTYKFKGGSPIDPRTIRKYMPR